MDDINSVTLVGRLTADPELRSFANGGSVCSMRLAYNTSKKNDGSWEDVPNFINISVFGTQGERCAEHLAKGRQVAVQGRLQYREWGDGDARRSATDIVANRVQFLGTGNSQPTQAAQPAPTSSPADTDDIPF